ncbi:hypothetical protein [Paenibacillus xylanexedens]|uniref:hypothetical protein n=1 Tax=Paenibacillus xylanexedens TaxID=528191 RepID=UPI001C8DD080|nr:hypothetical protein [Paenibacillus xylanexedens]MBY0117872.1 hypothetical protein [Paenibacillus xylanexedens]
MDTYKVNPQDIVSIYDEDKGFIGDATGEELAKEGPSWTGEIGLGDTVNTDFGEKRILEITTKFPNEGETVTRYKVVLGVYPKN